MALNITSFSPNFGYSSFDNKYVSITWTDNQPLYQDLGDGTYLYATTFYLWSASTSGTRLATLHDFSVVLSSNPSSLTLSKILRFSFPSLSAFTTYWVGGFSGGTRRSFSADQDSTTISLTFFINGGTGTTPGSISGNSGSVFLIPDSTGFSRPAYTFTGWGSNPSGPKLYNAGQQVQFYGPGPLYAIWQPSTYTIVVDENGGANVNNSSYTVGVAQDKVITRPAAPTGQIFSSWSLTINSIPTGSTINSSTNTISIPANDYGTIQARANWSYINYTITYDLGGGSGAHGNPTTYTYVTPTITLVQGSLTKTGYTFAGWFDAATGGNQVTSIPLNSTGNRTLYARWSVVNYTITYTLNGGTNAAGNPSTYNIESNTITLASPTRTGYTFNGWYSEAAFTNQITEIPTGSTGNRTLYAKWTATSYTITYTLNGGVNGANPATYTIESDTITLANGTRTGYTFGGWFSEETFQNQVTQIASGSVGNRTLYAKWNLIDYTITYTLNDGTNNVNNPATYNIESATITFSSPTRTGYSFDGWYAEAAFTNEITEIASGSIGNITIHAKWSTVSYSITYILDGGTNAAGNPATYTIESATITLADATKSGYSFAGWFTEAAFTNEVTEIVIGSTGNITLYAEFTINGYDVIFVNNGVEVQNTEEEFGATITFNGDTPTKTDPKNRYFFLGWNTNMSATTPLASLGTVPVGGTTFYAIYESFVSGLKINLKDVNIKVGTTQVKAVYKGETLIWEDYNE